MDIKKVIEQKIANMLGSPELKKEIACLVQDAVEADDPMLLMGPVSIFHEGALFNTAHLSDGEYAEFLEFMPNIVMDGQGYAENIEYLTGAQVYRLVKKYGLLSLTARILEAKEVAFDRLWDLVNEQVAPFEMKETVVLRGCRAVKEWDISVLDGDLSYTVEGQELTVRIPTDDAKKLFDNWGVTALIKELIGN